MELRTTTTAAILMLFLVIETLGFGQAASGESSAPAANKSRGGKNKESGHAAKPTTDGEIDPYSYEISNRLIYNMKKGSVKPAGDAANTELGKSEMGGSLMIGMLLTDHVEPFLEFSYLSVKREVAAYSSADTILDLGLGMLVNLPQSDGPKGEKEANTSEIMLAKWIPYIGILIGNSKATDSSGFTDAQGAKVNDSSTYTKFLVGTRWFMYQHVSLNFGARILYENSSTSAESASKTGADRSKLEVELSLLSMSLFI